MKNSDLGRRTASFGILGLILLLTAAIGNPLAVGAQDTSPSESTADDAQPPGENADVKSYTQPVESQNKGAIIPIRSMIDDVTYSSLKRRADRAIADGANVIVLELDTPGGYVKSAVDITKYLRKISDDGVKVVAWVRDEAISGGVMISMACDEIITSRNAHLGDCGVIQIGAGGASTIQDPALDAKIESYVLTVFRSAASREGYDPLLCEAFVRYEIEVWWLENTITGERRFVEPEEKKRLLGESDETNWKDKIFDASGAPQWKLVEDYIDPLDGKVKPLRQPVVSDIDLLTINQSMAYVLGFSKGIVADETQLQERYGLQADLASTRIERLWSEDFVSWLTSPTVRMILIALVGLGAYTEFKTPGLGAAGIVALIALLVLIGAPYLTGLANFWEIVIIGVGIGLICLEVLVIPGFGLAGISGLVLLLLGLLATFMPDEPGRFLPIYKPQLTQSVDGLKHGVVALASGLTTTLIGMVLISRYLPQMPYLKNIIPPNPTDADITIDDPYEGLALVGDVGTAESQLHPAGKARFGSQLVDVVTEGDLIDAGSTVEVIERAGNRVVVRRIS